MAVNSFALQFRSQPVSAHLRDMSSVSVASATVVFTPVWQPSVRIMISSSAAALAILM